MLNLYKIKNNLLTDKLFIIKNSNNENKQTAIVEDDNIVVEYQ